jgi:hypothetical protein
VTRIILTMSDEWVGLFKKMGSIAPVDAGER